MESDFEEINELARVLFPKKDRGDTLLLHHDFSFAVLSRYIRTVRTVKADGTVARRFVIWFRMYLQTKQNITQANTPTDRRLTLAEIESRLGISNLTEWVPPFAFRSSDQDPYTIVHGVYGGADKTFCVGTLRTKGQNKNPPKKNEVIELDLEDMPPGADAASYDGITQAYKKENSRLSTPRKKTIKVEKPQRASSNVMEQLSPVLLSKRRAAKLATTKIVRQKQKDKKLEQEEVGSLLPSGSDLSNEPTVASSRSGNKKRSSSIESTDTSTSSSSGGSDSDSSDEPKKKKRKRNPSKDKRRKKEKKRKSSKKQNEREINRNPQKITMKTNPLYTDADPTENEPAGYSVALVEPPSATPSKTSDVGEKIVVKPLVHEGDPAVYGNIATASLEQLQYEMARRIQQQKENTDTDVVDPIQSGETEK